MDEIKRNKEKIFQLIEEIYKYKSLHFIPGETPVTTGIALVDHREINAVIQSLLDGWLGLSVKGKEFEQKFSAYLNTSCTVFVNSGSSANLLSLEGIKKYTGISSGEIITPALTFPATFNPIVQLGFTPALVDVDKTLNIIPENIISAINDKTKGIFLTHMMGNPVRIDEICEIANKHNLFIIEDACGALGSKYLGRYCGTFGLASTFSFYPAHGITTGEGGAVCTEYKELDLIIRKLRDWGRDCTCTEGILGISGKCGNRFNYQIENIDYDHRYVFSQIGYNMKPLELQASMGIIQIERLNQFNEKRKRNFALYKDKLAEFSDHIELPQISDKADPVFFGLPIIIKDKSIIRKDLMLFLNNKKIATRVLFAGNILKQPAYLKVKCSVYGNLDYTDKLMRDCFWIGVHPGITEEMIQYVVSSFREYFNDRA